MSVENMYDVWSARWRTWWRRRGNFFSIYDVVTLYKHYYLYDIYFSLIGTSKNNNLYSMILTRNLTSKHLIGLLMIIMYYCQQNVEAANIKQHTFYKKRIALLKLLICLLVDMSRPSIPAPLPCVNKWYKLILRRYLLYKSSDMTP